MRSGSVREEERDLVFEALADVLAQLQAVRRNVLAQQSVAANDSLTVTFEKVTQSRSLFGMFAHGRQAQHEACVAVSEKIDRPQRHWFPFENEVGRPVIGRPTRLTAICQPVLPDGQRGYKTARP